MDKEIIDWLILTVQNRIENLKNDHEPNLIQDELKMANYVLYKLGKLQDIGEI